MKRLHLVRTIFALLISLMIAAPSMAAVLTLPAGTKVIKEEAFYGDTSLDEVELPEGIQEIDARAFAKSSVRKINLPESLTAIADDALDADAKVLVEALPDTYAYNWALDHHFLAASGKSLGLLYYNGIMVEDGCTIERERGDGAFVLTNDFIAMRLVLQMKVNNYSGMHFFAYPLNEEPDYNDPTQVGRRAGNFVWNIHEDMNSALARFNQGYINDYFASISSALLNQYPYFKIHLGFTDENGVTNWEAFGVHTTTRVRSITLEEFIVDVKPGDTTRITATVLPENADNKTLTWSSSDETVATVDGTGLVTAISPGITGITAKATDGSEAEDNVCINVKEDSPYAFQENVDGTLTVMAWKTVQGNADIPDKYNGKRITALKPGLFAGDKSLYNLIIHADIAVIPDNLCHGCPNLKGVILTDSVRTIGANAFTETSMPLIALPSSVSQISDSAFDVSTRISAPEGSMAYQWAEDRNKLCMSSPVEWFTFEDNGDGTCTLTGSQHYISGRQCIVFPKYDSEGRLVVKIGAHAFDRSIGYNYNLQYIVFPDSLKEIGNCAFAYCTGLSGLLNIPDSVTTIGESAFYYCAHLTEIRLPSNIKHLGSCAFDRCFSLSGDFIYPSTLQEIPPAAFYMVGSEATLERFVIPDGITNIGYNAFTEARMKHLYINSSTARNISIHGDGFKNVTVDQIHCSQNSAAWQWFSEHGYADKLVDWDDHYVSGNESAYDTWWNSNVAPYYKLYLAKTLSTDEIATDHNFLLRKMAELSEIMKDDFINNANQLQLRFNTENNYWLLDDDARLRLTLMNLAKTLEEDDEKDSLIVRGDLTNLSPAAIANEQVAQTDDQMNRIKDAWQFATSGIELAITNYIIANNLTGEGSVELDDEQKAIKALLKVLKDAIVQLPIKAMDAIKEIQGEYDAALILRAYVREYTDAMKEVCDKYADYLEYAYFGPYKELNSAYEDYYSQAVRTFINAFITAKESDEALINIARQKMLEGTGYTYEEVLESSGKFSSDWLSRLDDKFWCQVFVDALRSILKSMLKEMLPHFQEDMLAEIADKLITTTVNDDLTVSVGTDVKGAMDKILELDGQMTIGELLTGIELFGGEPCAINAIVLKTAMLGKKPADYDGFNIGKSFKDNVAVAGKIFSIVKTAYSFVEGAIYSIYDLAEVAEINNGKEVYDSYGCALIDSFGQRLNLRANGEILTGLTEEHFANWTVKKKDAQRRALVSLLNLDEYIVITYKNMKMLNNNSSYSFTPGDYEWETDAKIDYALNLIRNIRTAIKNVPEDCKIYDND